MPETMVRAVGQKMILWWRNVENVEVKSRWKGNTRNRMGTFNKCLLSPVYMYDRFHNFKKTNKIRYLLKLESIFSQTFY